MSKVVITRSKLDGLATTISAKSGEPLPLTIAQMDAAVQGIETGGNDFVVTLSYNEQTEMWEPDKTFSEIEAAYEAGKTIAFESPTDSYTAVSWSVELSSPGTVGRFYYGIGVENENSEWFVKNYVLDSSGVIFDYDYTYYPAPTLQSKTISYTPSETAQSATVTADSGYDGLSSVDVTVGAISSTYVGSGITRRSSSDLTASGATVTVPAGYYSAQASKAVASGTAGTPTATKGTVSNHAVSVTPSVTNTAGYIAGGTKNGTAVTVSASELVSGSQTITANGTVNVTNLASVTVDIDFVTYHTSSSEPTSSQGSDGDIWLVTE